MYSPFLLGILSVIFAPSLTVSIGFDGRLTRAVNVSSNPGWADIDPIYQIYPRSFKDSDGDGVGDIQGIISKLDYIRDLGVKAIWLSPYYPSPGADFGYDISDFYDVDPLFGSLEDFKQLVGEAKSRGLGVIADFVVGHASTESDYFKHSVKREGRFTDYFIWSDGKLDSNGTRVPPNNWLSVFGGSAWEWNEERGQFYYHAFLKEQANFNHRNPEVEREMKSIIQHWFEIGVAGLRVDAIPFAFVTTDLSLDEPRSNIPGAREDEHSYLDHIYTMSQPEVMGAVKDYMSVVNKFNGLMILETYERNQTLLAEYYKAGAVPFNMMFTGAAMTGHEINKAVSEYLMDLPDGALPNFVLGNHDVRRISTRAGSELCAAYNTLLLTLPGLATTYYGEELGMTEPKITWEQNVDPQGGWWGPTEYVNHTRDYERSPMQWTPGHLAGFTSGNSTWLPIPENYKAVNVEVESAAPLPGQRPSTLALYKQVIQLRQNDPVFQSGRFRPAVVDQDVFSYILEGKRSRMLVAMNVGDVTVTHSYIGYAQTRVAKILLDSHKAKDSSEPYLDLASVTLKPGQVVIISLGKPNSAIVG